MERCVVFKGKSKRKFCAVKNWLSGLILRGRGVKGEVAQGLVGLHSNDFRDPTNYPLGQNFDREWRGGEILTASSARALHRYYIQQPPQAAPK